MLPVFRFGFFSALVSSYFDSSSFLRGCSERILSALVPNGRFWRNVLGSAVFFFVDFEW